MAVRPPHLIGLTPGAYVRQRILESIPAVLTWGTFIGCIVLAAVAPFLLAYGLVLYSLTWLIKATHVSIHLMYTYGRLQDDTSVDWVRRLADLAHPRDAFLRTKTELRTLQEQPLPGFWLRRQRVARGALRRKRRTTRAYLRTLTALTGRTLPYRSEEIYHVVLIPSVREGRAILETTLAGILATGYPTDHMLVLLACEARAGRTIYEDDVRYLQEKFHGKFWRLEATVHPANVPGEIQGRGPNATYGMRRATAQITAAGVPLDRVLVSSFDADTIPARDYFHQLTYAYLTTPHPTRHSYQPTALFFNNLWDAPMLSRVSAMGSTFWQMIEASRSHRLVTFSSHAIPLASLVAVDYWPKDVVQDDSHIFWQLFIHYAGDYDVVPLFTTVTMDCVLGTTYWETLKAQYKQKRRWAWGVGDFAYVSSHFWRPGSPIPLQKRIVRWFRLVEGHYTWATTAIVLAVGGWLPILFGPRAFTQSVVSENFFATTRTLLTIALVGLFVSVAISLLLLPPPPPNRRRLRDRVAMVFQWVLTPVATIVLGSLPAIEAQTRYLFGRYLGFFVTPKVRRSAVALPHAPSLPSRP